MSRLLALVPARGGSKRIPGKNIKPLCGQPLIAYTIANALKANCFSRIIVSTDDPQTADVARDAGAEVPWLRSAETSGDTSSSVDVILEVLSRMEADGDTLPDAVMLLQPTSPFRSVESIHRAIALYETGGGESVVSVSLAKSHPYWCKSLSTEGELLPFLPEVDSALRSQDLPPVYALNGLIYLASIANIRERCALYSEHTRALLVESEEETVDIDTPFDWLVAEAVCQARQEGAA